MVFVSGNAIFMLKHHRVFFLRILTVCCALLTYSTATLAWGPEGHSTIGTLALIQLQEDSRRELAEFVDLQDEQAMVDACNWPDVIRETEEGVATSPQHYINIPRGEFDYLQSRDCPDGLCATEAIKRYAAELADREAGNEQRWQAFAWLCHVVGDLHQPLHAGFADDRGGNNFEIVFKGEQMNLHGFWDSELIHQYAANRYSLLGILGQSMTTPESSDWSENTVDDWTNESHQLAKHRAYPEDTEIDDAFEQQCWDMTQQRMNQAGSRLAWILNTVLKKRD